MRHGGAQVDVVPFTAAYARIAQEAYLRYGRGSGHPAKLNFGDCVSYALAKASGQPLLFKGDDFPTRTWNRPRLARPGRLAWSARGRCWPSGLACLTKTDQARNWPARAQANSFSKRSRIRTWIASASSSQPKTHTESRWS